MIDKNLKTVIDFMIGDGFVDGKRKESRIRIEHSIAQKEYAYYKYNKLLELGLPVSIREYTSTTTKNNGRQYVRIDSRQHPIFSTAYKYLYNKGRKAVDKSLLKQLDAESLAYWFMDDGYAKHTHSLQKKTAAGKIYYDYVRPITSLYGLCTDSFTYEENLLICDWIKQTFDIWTRPHKHSKTTWRVYFGPLEAKDKLLQHIKPFIIPSMKYKISAPHSFKDIPFVIKDENGFDITKDYDLIQFHTEDK